MLSYHEHATRIVAQLGDIPSAVERVAFIERILSVEHDDVVENAAEWLEHVSFNHDETEPTIADLLRAYAKDLRKSAAEGYP